MFDGNGCNVGVRGWRVPACVASCFLLASIAPAAAGEWGTYLKPFAANSPWNSRPVAPVLGDFVISKASYFPKVGEGIWSLGVFLAKASDGPATVSGLPGAKGLWEPDAEVFLEGMTIPRWPPDTTPAEASDGHADIVDPVTGIVHSFHKLRNQNGRWVASHYAWTRIDGRGWGDPAHYFQGARAAAVPSMAGLIRKHEVSDGDTIYRHALALSLTFNALSPKPGYVFPATSSDGNLSVNSGAIPEGALLMLPESFDARQISNPALRKVAETLKVYGAYVVDRNVGTPFYIYVENGSGFDLHRPVWNNAVAGDLERIRLALRQVVSTSGWVDGDGRPFTPERNLNLLSMRGPWQVKAGTVPGVFDTWSQAVMFPETTTRTVQANATSRGMNAVSWAIPAPGTKYRLTAIATGGAKLRFQLREKSEWKVVVDSNELGNGESATFAWPEQPVQLTLLAISGVGQASTVRGNLTAVAR